MFKYSYKHAATITLALTTLLFLISYPFSKTFWGGLAASAFSAAMIGGFADWFAVTALFRRPLMIPFRTAVIPNNKERIFASIVHMVEKELITSENVERVLTKANLSKIIIERFFLNQTQERLHNLFLNMTKEWLLNLEPKKTGILLAELFCEHLKKVKITVLFGQCLSWLIKKGFFDRLLDIILDECQRFVNENYFKNIISTIVLKAQDTYSGSRMRREMALLLAENFLKLTPEKTAILVQNELSAHLTTLKDNDNTFRRRIKAFFVKLSIDIREDPAYDAQIEKWKENFLTAERMAGILEKPTSSLIENFEKNPELLGKYLSMAGDEINCALKQDHELEKWLDAVLIESLSNLASEYHDEIGKMVSEYLQTWSSEKLSAYIEEKVGDDLQMIRINGSVVGGMVGAALYLVTFFLGI